MMLNHLHFIALILVALCWKIQAQGNFTLSAEEQDAMLTLLEDLVNIESTSGNEMECGVFLDQYLSGLGFYVEPYNESAQFNIFAYPQELKDAGELPDYLLTTHMDTVPPFIPFSSETLDNGTQMVKGRGTTDAKSPLVATIFAWIKARDAGIDISRFGLLYVYSEETGGAGMKAFSRWVGDQKNFSAVIFGEPTESNLATGHKGSVGLTFNLTGVAAHSAYEELGVSAVDYLAEAIVALNTLEPYLPKGELLGDSTLNTGRIAGGLASNIVAASANASTSVRVAGGELDTFEELITIALQPIKERMDAAGSLFQYNITKNYGAIILDTDFDFLPQKAMKYGTDIPSLPQVEKRYLFGPGSITVAHTPGEFLLVPELLAAVEAYGQMIEQLAGDSP